MVIGLKKQWILVMKYSNKYSLNYSITDFWVLELKCIWLRQYTRSPLYSNIFQSWILAAPAMYTIVTKYRKVL